MKKLLIGSILAWCAGSAANATVYTETWTGVVTSGNDDLNQIFGGGDLTGQSFTTTYVFDDTKGILYNNDSTHEISGGTIYSGGQFSQYRFTPVITSSITINGYTFNVSGDYTGEFAAGQSETESYQAARSSIGAITLYNLAENFSLGSFGDKTFVWSANVSGVDANVGYIDLGSEKINLKNITFSSMETDVPEPALWTMFIGGFGMIGAMMRRKKTAVSFA